MEGTPITTDVSLFLPHALSLSPVEYWWRRRLLLRIPYYWEDDFEMGLPAPDWELTSRLKKADGLKVFDFHPIHIYLNSPSVNPYQRFKKQAPRLSESTKAQADSFVHLGKGTQTFFLQLVDHLAERESHCVKDISMQWRLRKESARAG